MKQKILIELDALLDTRIATVSRLNPEAALELLSSEYRERPCDDLGRLTKLITTEQYEEAYRKRDRETLIHARPTLMPFVLNEIVSRLEQDMFTTGARAESTEIEVNIYPYELNEQEREAIATAVMARAGLVTPVRTVSYPPFHLSPRTINTDEYSALIIYNLQEWVDGALRVALDFRDCCPTVTLMAPALLNRLAEKLEPADLVDKDGQLIDPFRLHSQLLAPIIGLDFMPVEFFSLMDLNELVKGE